MRYAERLDVPLAYSSNGRGIVEHDYDTGRERNLSEFPSPEELYRRYRAWRGIVDDRVAATLQLPFDRSLRNPDASVKEPRYYQRVAIQRALQAILSGKNRVLLTMATGSGKTFTALQVIWKLWSSDWRGGRRPRFLYLADRNILVDQPIAREFRPVFGDAIWKLRADAQFGREVYFALYQALSDSPESLGLFRDYPPDYFDLVVVDECHRGSARDDSSWRGILEYFAPATQLGMTATPKHDDNVDTYAYFGDPVYQYSLAQGIEDGFLAPYRVRRVVLSPDAFGFRPDPGQLDRYGREVPDGLYGTPHFERVVSLLLRMDLAAQHLTGYLQRTDPMAKTIVFCVDSEHANQMRQALNNANVDLARQYPNYVARIVSDEGPVGREHLGNFADPQAPTPVIATTSKLLSTSIDLPTVKNIVLFKPIGSMVDFKQIVGRGTRLYPDEDKLTFEILDYSGATVLFSDPEFDGPPERVVEETIDETGEPGPAGKLEEGEGEFEEPPPDEPEPDELDRRTQKFYIDRTAVYLVAEGVYVPDTATGRLTLVEYSDYVAREVWRLFPSASNLRTQWHHRVSRQEVVEGLDARGISFDELAERTGLAEADPFDILVHLAWNSPVLSRFDRVQRLRQKHPDLFAKLEPAARAVLNDLLTMYAEHGITQLDNLRSLEVPPLPEHYGTVV